MKKSKLLSIATAAAIVATTFGTYAVWDTMEGTAKADLTLRKPVAVTAATPDAFNLSNDSVGVDPEYTSNVTFKVANADKVSTGYNIRLTTEVKNGEDKVTDNFTVTYSGNEGLSGDVDSSVTAENQYTVTITPKDDDATKALATDTPLKVNVTAKLEKVAAE